MAMHVVYANLLAQAIFWQELRSRMSKGLNNLGLLVCKGLGIDPQMVTRIEIVIEPNVDPLVKIWVPYVVDSFNIAWAGAAMGAKLEIHPDIYVAMPAVEVDDEGPE